MSRGPSLFRQRDVTRAFKAARAAGVDVRLEIEPGKMTIIAVSGGRKDAPNINEWDEVLDPAKTKIRS